MYMYLNDLLIRNNNNGIADRFQIRFQLVFLLFAYRLLQHNNKFCAISELNISFLLNRHCISVTYSLIHTLRLLKYHFFSEERIVTALQNLHESLTARVNNSCLLQDRQHFRRLIQHILRMLDHLSEERFQIRFPFLCQFHTLLGNTFRNSQDCPFLRLHDSFVCRIHRFCKGIRQNRNRHLFVILDSLRKTTKKLGKNDS